MRKLTISLLVLFAIALGIFIYFYLQNNNNSSLEQTLELANTTKVEDECTDFALAYEKELQNQAIQANFSEYAISPNATIIKKIYYEKCGNTIKEYENVSNELVNMKYEEFQELHPDWEIEGFSANEIVMSKQLDQMCNEHYIIRINNGNLVVYNVDESDNETLYKTTDISTKYLPETDLIKIKNGLTAHGKENLNSILEDFE